MPSLRILHLSDTHLFGDGSLHYGSIDTEAHLRATLAHVENQPFDLVVCSGDVSEDGTTASYALARTILADWAAERGARVICAMGNHDSRAEFRAVLGEGQLGVRLDPLTLGSDPSRPLASVATVAGWRTIVLDTSVPGAGYGELGADQLDALSQVLAKPAEHGTILVMHHPPVAAQTDLLNALALDEASTQSLYARLRGSDVRAILSGHYHHAIVEAVHGIPVVVAPGVANLARAFGDPREESAGDSYGGVVIEVADGRERFLPFVQPATGNEVFRFNANEVRQIVSAAGRPASGSSASVAP